MVAVVRLFFGAYTINSKMFGTQMIKEDSRLLRLIERRLDGIT